MAFIGDFSVVQNDESTITLTDASTGTDPTITERRIYLYKFDNTTIVPAGTSTDYIVWAIDAGIGDSITLEDILDKDYAVNITVVWFTPTPDPTNTYTKSQLYNFDFYAMLFLAGLTTEDAARNPNIVDDTNYFFYKIQFYDYVVQARISVGLMNDIFKAQYNLDKTQTMRNNQTLYF